MVIWLIGLSGAGKTVIGREVYKQWKQKESNTVFVDGDEIRSIFRHDKNEESYSLKGRQLNADRICEICRWLDKQDINVVCCILSIFEQSRIWNRENLKEYFEVFISTPFEVLLERDINNLYKPALSGEIKNVVGVDLPFEEPEHSDYILDNSDAIDNFSIIAADILKKAKGNFEINHG